MTVAALQKYGVQIKLYTVKVLRGGEGKEKKEPGPSNTAPHVPRTF